MSFLNKMRVKYLVVLVFSSLFFQNFVFPTKPETLNNINSADPALALALKKIDDSFLDYTQQLNRTKARGRIAQLDFEHKKMKSDLIRAASILNPELLNTSAEAGNYAADSATLNAIMQIPNRRQIYVVSVQNATSSSLPTTVKIVWTGTAAQRRPLLDVILVSNISHTWNFIDEGVNASTPKSYVVSPNFLPEKSILNHNLLPNQPIASNLVFPIQPNTTTKAQYMMDELVRQSGSENSFDYDLKGNYAVNAGGSLTISISESPTVTAPLKGPLTALMDGTPYTLPAIASTAPEAILAPSIFPTNVSAEEAFRYADYYEKNYVPYPPSVEIFWRGLLIKPARLSLPQAQTLFYPLQIFADNTLKLTTYLISQNYALTVCNKFIASEKSATEIKCVWNGSTISQVVLPAPIPPGFQQLSLAIFAPKCLQCHNSTTTLAGLNVSSYEAIMKPANFYVIPGNPNQSRLFIRMAQGNHPPNAPPLSNSEMDMIYRWIATGANK